MNVNPVVLGIFVFWSQVSSFFISIYIALAVAMQLLVHTAPLFILHSQSRAFLGLTGSAWMYIKKHQYILLWCLPLCGRIPHQLKKFFSRHRIFDQRKKGVVFLHHFSKVLLPETKLHLFLGGPVWIFFFNQFTSIGFLFLVIHPRFFHCVVLFVYFSSYCH